MLKYFSNIGILKLEKLYEENVKGEQKINNDDYEFCLPLI